MANIVIMPGGFHPFHAGHAALYNSIKEKYGDSDVYVAASDNQKERPFPFKIKEKLAQISGVQPGEFVQVKSPFVPKEITDKYDPEKDSIVFVRSEKDRNEYPKTGMIKKDGSPGYFHSVDKGITEPFGKVGYIDYLPVKKFAGITSATQIRDAWPNLNDDQREDFVTQIYPNIANNKKLIKNVVKLLSQGMSLNEGLAYIDDKGNRVDYTRPDLPTDIRRLVIDWFNDRDRYTKATLKQKGYTVDIDDKFDNIDIVDKKGRKFTVKVDDAMNDLIQQAYAEPMNEDKPVARYNTKQAMKMIRRYCQEKGIPIRKILKQGKRYGGHLDERKRLIVMIDPAFDQGEFNQETQHYEYPAFTQNDANEIQVMLDAPRVTITGGGSYLNVHGLMQGELNDPPLREAFVDPDQSKQYWNHDAQKIGVGGEIEMPLTDTPNLNGRRQGFNESDEIPVIYEKTVEALVNAFEGHADEFESREAIEANIYNKLSQLKVPDVVNPKFKVHGQPIGNYSSGRVIDVVDSGSVIDEVLQQINYVSEGLGKMVKKAGSKFLDYLAGSIFNKDFGGEKPRIDVFKHNPLVNGSRQVVLTFKNGYGISIVPEYELVPGRGIQQRIIHGSYEVLQLQKAGPKATEGIQLKNGDLYISSGENMRRLDDAQLYMAIMNTVMLLPIQNDPVVINATESMNKIRGMIKETTDEQKSKSVHLHRKLFELMEEERNNVVKLRGFGREADKPIPDINKVRAEKEKEQERENNRYSERRAEQEELLARLQAELLNAKQEFSELADAQLLPVEMLDAMENVDKLIDFIENWEGSEEQNNFPFTESILEKLQLKTVQLKEYFGGTRDRSAPRVLRQQTPKLDINSFWNTTDLTETADYIEEK